MPRAVLPELPIPLISYATARIPEKRGTGTAVQLQLLAQTFRGPGGNVTHGNNTLVTNANLDPPGVYRVDLSATLRVVNQPSQHESLAMEVRDGTGNIILLLKSFFPAQTPTGGEVTVSSHVVQIDFRANNNYSVWFTGSRNVEVTQGNFSLTQLATPEMIVVPF